MWIWDGAVHCINFLVTLEHLNRSYIPRLVFIFSWVKKHLHCPPNGMWSLWGPLSLSVLQSSTHTGDLDTGQENSKTVFASVETFLTGLPAGSLLSGPPLHFTCSSKCPVNQSPKGLLLCNYLPMRDAFLIQKLSIFVFSYLFSPKFQPQICNICNIQGIFCVEDTPGIFKNHEAGMIDSFLT